MANEINKKKSVIKPNDFITVSPYFHSYADAFSEKEKELALHGSYSTRAYTKDFGPIAEKVAPAPVAAAPVIEAEVKKSKKELAREAAEAEAAQQREAKKRRIEEAKLLKRQERIKKIKRKRIKREKDYFFVMNKGLCVIMIIFMLLTLALMSISIVGMDAIEPYTSAFKQPDLTPVEERIATTDPETGEEIPYAEQVSYIGFLDPVYGFAKASLGLELGESPLYDAQVSKAELEGMDPIAAIVLVWYPVALLLFAVLVLLNLIKAFFGILGRRIFKRFGLNSILMMIMVVAFLFAGYCTNLEAGAPLDFAGLLPFATQLFSSPVDGAGALSVVMGIGSIGLFVLSILSLLLSFGIRKKVPYSIFD